ncbi:MAG TPA: CBS domain-containing protein [Steroidobacteraceae bacterium]|nr:CBS domain-containing protein [Steroidobacteraceae bacterium]
MFVSMWMTRELITVDPAASLASIAATMSRHRIRRLPVVSPSLEGPRLVGIVSHSDVLHAFPADINPFSANAADSVAALERTRGRARVYAADLMARDPLVTTPDAPIESAARVMRDRKIGALPVVSQHTLVGLITESDIFRAMVEVFEEPRRAVRITFSLGPDEDVLPLVAEIARRRAMRVTSFMALPRHEPPLCVVQLAGEAVEETLEDVWKSKHRVMNVVNLIPEAEKVLPP